MATFQLDKNPVVLGRTYVFEPIFVPLSLISFQVMAWHM